MRRRDGSPIWLADEEPARVLDRADLNGKSESGSYSEAWLQKLLHENPKAFPVEQIEAGFGDLVPLCCELPLALGGSQTGYLDNLFVTPNGGLVLVEVKLWRNPEARRAAIAQGMEYAAAVFRMGYSELDAAVQKARAAGRLPSATIFELVAKQHPGADQAEFHDAVSRNLAKGRAIIAVLGDGIREEMLSLAGLVHGHAGHRFTFALVELAVYQVSANARVIIPSVLAQTVLIERGVVRVEGDAVAGVKVEITAVPVASGDDAGNRRMSISEDEFFEALGKKDPATFNALRAFLAKTETLGIYADFRRSLNLKHPAPEGKSPLNLGVVAKDGSVDTGFSTQFGRIEAGRRYNEVLAAAIGGEIKEYADKTGAVKTRDGKTPRLSDFLPQHDQLWLDAMSRYISDICSRQEGRTTGAVAGEDQSPSEEQLRNLAHERVTDSRNSICSRTDT